MSDFGPDVAIVCDNGTGMVKVREKIETLFITLQGSYCFKRNFLV